MSTEVVVPSDSCCWDLPVRRSPIGVDVHFRIVLCCFLFIKLLTGVNCFAKEVMMKLFEVSSIQLVLKRGVGQNLWPRPRSDLRLRGGFIVVNRSWKAKLLDLSN